jgi:hypothetical protein
MRANVKIHFHNATQGDRGEIAIGRETPARIFGSVILPEELATPHNAAVALVFRSLRTLGGISVTVGTRVIPRHGSAYSATVKSDALIDLSVAQAGGETRTLEWTVGDLPNASAGALLLVEVQFLGQNRLHNMADGELVAALVAIDIVGSGEFGMEEVLALLSLRA